MRDDFIFYVDQDIKASRIGVLLFKFKKQVKGAVIMAIAHFRYHAQKEPFLLVWQAGLIFPKGTPILL